MPATPHADACHAQAVLVEINIAETHKRTFSKADGLARRKLQEGPLLDAKSALASSCSPLLQQYCVQLIKAFARRTLARAQQMCTQTRRPTDICDSHCDMPTHAGQPDWWQICTALKQTWSHGIAGAIWMLELISHALH